MKKGQASVEYIMTYGWALLAVVIVLGLLLTSGVFSVDYGLDQECNFGSKFPCSSTIYNSGSNTHVAVNFINSFPYAVNLTNFTFNTDDSSVIISTSGSSFIVESGSNLTLNGVFSTSAPLKSTVKIIGNFTYLSCASEISEDSCAGLPHIVSGRISSKVIEG